MARPSEARPKRKPAQEQRIYTSSPLAGGAPGTAKVLIPPPSPRPPLSPAPSAASLGSGSGSGSGSGKSAAGATSPREETEKEDYFAKHALGEMQRQQQVAHHHHHQQQQQKPTRQQQLRMAIEADQAGAAVPLVLSPPPTTAASATSTTGSSTAPPSPSPSKPPASSSAALAVPADNIDERRLSGVGTYGVGLGLLSSDTMSDSDDSDDEELLSPRARSPHSPPAVQPVLSRGGEQQREREEKPRVPPSAPVVGLGITVPSSSSASGPSTSSFDPSSSSANGPGNGKAVDTSAKHAALFAAATQPVAPLAASPSPVLPHSPVDKNGPGPGPGPSREQVLSPPPPAYSPGPQVQQQQPPQQQQRHEYAAPVPRPVPRPLQLGAPPPGPGQAQAQAQGFPFPPPGQRGPPQVQMQMQMRQPGPGPIPRANPHGPYPSPHAPYLTPPPRSHQSPYNSPSDPLLPPPTPSSFSPHPLPPSSPITPLFAAPRSQRGSVRFSMAIMSPLQAGVGALGIMRSEKEDALPVRKREREQARASAAPSALAGFGRSGTTDDGDAFWRRFSMVAKEENRKPAHARESGWLAKRLATSRSSSRILIFSVCVGVLLLGGGIACAWYFTHRGGDTPTAPVAIGGSAGESGETTSAAAHISTWVPPIKRHPDALFDARATGVPRRRHAALRDALGQRGMELGSLERLE